MVGTPQVRVACSVSMSSRTRPGSKAGTSTAVAELWQSWNDTTWPPTWKQRHGLDVDVAGPHPEAQGPEARRVGHAPVGEQRTLGRARRPRGVDELGHVVGRHRRATGPRRRPRRHAAQNSSQSSKTTTWRNAGRSARSSVEGGTHVVAPVVGHDEDPRRARLAEDVAELAGAQGGVHGHEDDAGQRRRVAEDERLGDARWR